ncbi:MAG: hypothetical protein R2991_12185 [Thermoanaerobaculia bacterium]
MKRSEELYVGYRKRAPEGVARFLRPRLALLAVLLAALGALVAAAQRPFDPGRFGLGDERTVEGVLLEHPYPMVAVGDEGRGDLELLVLFGKHGAAPAVRGLDGHRVRLRGTPIERGRRTMLQLVDGTLEDLAVDRASLPEPVDVGPAVLRGEIVDTKCFLGVMKPSREAPHRECARNCVAGGIPPALWVPTGEGEDALFLLVDRHGMPVGPVVLPWIGRPVELRGAVWRVGDVLLLAVEGYRAVEAA